VRAYSVMGRETAARSALATARQVFEGEPEALARLDQAAGALERNGGSQG